MPLRQRLLRFAHVHDSVPSFHAGYLVVTFVIAALLNVGAFAILIALHMGLDVLKYRRMHRLSWPLTLRGVLLESAFDLLLLSVAALAVVYLHTRAGLVALSGIVRSLETILRGAVTVVPKAEVLHRELDVLTNGSVHLRDVDRRIAHAWPRSARVHFLCIAVCVVLIALAPALLNLPGGDFLRILREEFVPWNF